MPAKTALGAPHFAYLHPKTRFENIVAAEYRKSYPFITVGCDRNRMPLLSKASNVVQNVFFLYDVTGFTQIGHSIPVATNERGRTPQ